jgi:Flp pilus assembly protein TadG
MMFEKLVEVAREIHRSEEGAVAIQMALMLTLMLGMAGLATDFGFVLYKQRQMQSAADAAAFSAAVASYKGYPNYITEGSAVAGAYSFSSQPAFVNGQNLVTVTVQRPVSPPASAASAANPLAVQVIIKQTLTLPLVGAVCALIPGATCSGTINAQAQAVAAVTNVGACATSSPDSPCTCVLALNGSASPAVAIGNGATLALKACGMQVCSNNATNALSVTGGATLNLLSSTGAVLPDNKVQSVSVVGGVTFNGGSHNNSITTCISCVTGAKACAASADPYYQVPNQTAPTGCGLGTSLNYAYHSGNPAYTLSPGVWCNGVTFGGGMTFKLNPGVYYVNAGAFDVGGGATLTGTGVTIVLTGSGTNYANVNIEGGAVLNLTAPTSGATAGIAFFGDERAPATVQNTFGGGASANITGALYFPTEQVTMNNGVSNPSSCTQLIAGQITFQGGANFSRNCPTGTSPIGSSTGAPSLLE